MNPAKSRLIQLNPGCASAPANKTKPPGPLCCHPVASLLPVSLPLKRLTDNEVTDVATFGTAIRDAGLTRVRFPSPPPFFRLVAPQRRRGGLLRAIRWRLAKMGIKVNQGQSRLIKPNQPFIFLNATRSRLPRQKLHGRHARTSLRPGTAALPVRARPRALRYDFLPCRHPTQSTTTNGHPITFSQSSALAVTLARLCGRGRPRSRSAPVLGR
jgi:hypothetical protein